MNIKIKLLKQEKAKLEDLNEMVLQARLANQKTQASYDAAVRLQGLQMSKIEIIIDQLDENK